MNKLLVIQRTLPGAPNDGQFISYDFDILNDHLSSIEVTVLDAPSTSYESFDDYVSISKAGLLKSILSVEFDVIAIPATYGPSPLSYDGFQLAMHIRLSIELQKKRYVPIILMGFEELGQLAQLGCSYLSFLSTPQVYYTEESFDGLLSFVKNEWQFLKPIDNQNLVTSLAQYPITPPPHLESNHSLANEWGALELDQLTANVLSGQPEWIENSLYIKYLKVKLGYASGESDTLKLSEVLNEGKPFNPNQKPKILYIDDEYNKGWEQTLKAIFEEAKIEFDCVKELKKGQSRQEVLKLIKDKLKSDDWNLILLDIRLTEQDYQEENSINFSGLEALKIIKQHNPILPVIMFTASTKAKTLDSFTDHGADGFYIKYSPDINRTPATVRNDVTALFALVKICLQKYAVLFPFWKGIRDIENVNLIQEKRVGTPEETCFHKRILERLCMFIGLLKKTYEETAFDRDNFYYEESETAFLTLWSCLNEISECYFEKTSKFHPFNSTNNSCIYLNNDNTRIEVLEWHLEVGGRSQYFIKYLSKPKLNNSGNYSEYQGKYIFQETSEIYLRKNSPFYVFDQPPVFKEQRILYANALQMQIAFIIYKKFIFLRWSIKEHNLQKLHELNKLRNHLYLTHGDNDTNADYTKTLRDTNVKVTMDDIKNLFGLVYFLLKGIMPNI
ncbi:hypothetical protein [Spirosoma jeollabukense]